MLSTNWHLPSTGHRLRVALGCAILGVLFFRIFLNGIEVWRPFMYVSWILLAAVVVQDRRWAAITLHPAVLPGLLLLAYFALTLAWGGGQDVDHFLTWIPRLMAFWLAIVLACQVPSRHLLLIANALLGIACLAGIYAAATYLMTVNPTILENGGGAMRNDVVPGILSLAILGPAMVIACMATAIMIRQCLGHHSTLAILIACIPVAVYVLLTRSRGPMISMAIWFAVLLLTSHFTWRRRGLIVAGLILLGAVFWLAFPGYVAHLIDRGGSNRLILWHYTLTIIPNDLWFGHGLNFDFLTSSIQPTLHKLTGAPQEHPHNLALATLLYGGLAGLLLLALTTVSALIILCLRNRRATAYALPVIVVLLLLTTTDTHRLVESYNITPIWFIFWLPSAFIAGLAVRSTSIYACSESDTW